MVLKNKKNIFGVCFKQLFTYVCLISCLSAYNNSWTQSSDLIVYPTLTFYSSDAPTVADLFVREQNIAGTIVWYDQKVGGTAQNSTDPLDPNKSYWAELPGASIGERLQTKIYFANTKMYQYELGTGFFHIYFIK